MKTVITSSEKEAAKFITSGEIVAFPTETVYGLGANIFDETAVKKIFEVKGRPRDNPLIVHIHELSQIDLLAKNLSPMAKEIIRNFFPSPLTVVVKKKTRNKYSKRKLIYDRDTNATIRQSNSLS